MISRTARQLYYSAIYVPVRVYGAIRRRLWRPGTGPVKVHLGCGRRHHLAGWINVDGNVITARPEVWADLTAPLPFPDESVDAFYSHHVIEHLPDDVLPRHLAELHRCLKPGGAVRIGGPNAHEAMLRYVAGDHAWFDDFPRRRTSVGGRLANFILCANEHLAILTPSYLEELLSTAGFARFTVVKPITETGYPELFDQVVLGSEWEPTPEKPHTLLVEAAKPMPA